jgi:hypothetical protein
MQGLLVYRHECRWIVEKQAHLVRMALRFAQPLKSPESNKELPVNSFFLCGLRQRS